MYGAILGDIIGRPYEFDRGDKSKNFPMFNTETKFTDDTVMTIAVAKALIKYEEDKSYDDEQLKKWLIYYLKKWGKMYPDAGYGLRFHKWLNSDSVMPYGSYGNGSAMRVSAVGWLSDNVEEARHLAAITASVTHNHCEGIKGAEATASAICLARMGYEKKYIKNYIENNFAYDLNRTLASIRAYYHHVESCQETVPEAIIAFLESASFEDAIRNAVSLGGDTDTLAAITGSIAEAYYGVPDWLVVECRSRVDKRILRVIDVFNKIRKKRIDRTQKCNCITLLTKHLPMFNDFYTKYGKSIELFGYEGFLRKEDELDNKALNIYVMEAEKLFDDIGLVVNKCDGLYPLSQYYDIQKSYCLVNDDGKFLKQFSPYNKNADYSSLDERAILALIMQIYRDYRYSYGSFFQHAILSSNMCGLLKSLLKLQDEYNKRLS